MRNAPVAGVERQLKRTMTTNWRTYGRDTVACRLNRAEIPGLLRKQVLVGPGEAAVVIRDGKVEQVLTQESTKVAGFWDGVQNWGWVKALRGTSPNVDVVFVDLSPLDIPVYLGTRAGSQEGSSESTHFTRDGIEHTQSANAAEVILVALSRDKEVITAECHVRCAVHLESAVKVAGLLKGREALSVWDLAALVREQILGPVLLPLIAAHDAGEFRSSQTLRTEIEEQVRAQVGPALADRGFAFEGLSVAWGMTDAEVQEVQRNRARREEEAVDFEHKRAMAEMQREQQVERTRLVNLQELAVAEKQGDEELKGLLLLGELRRDVMVEGKRVDLARIDAQVREVQLDVDQREHAMRLAQRREEETLALEIEDRRFKQEQAARLAAIDAEDEEMADLVKLQIQMATAKHDREMAARRLEIDARLRAQQAQLDHEAQQRKLRLDEDQSRMGITERVLAQAIASGVADPSVLRTMLEQATEQSYATATDEKVAARSDAAAAKHNLDTFKDAEDRERQQQKDMTRLATDMMQGAKQTPASSVVLPGGAPPQPSGSGGGIHIVNAPAAPSESAAGRSEPTPDAGPQCPSCHEPVKAGWKACPHCGARLDSGRCSCGAELKPGWKVCPECGKAIVNKVS